MNILFINTAFSIDSTESGGSVRSIMLLQSLCDCANVDVINFHLSKSVAVKDCNVIYTCESQGQYSQNWSRWKKFKSLFCFWNAYSYYPKDINKELIIDSFVKQKQYDFIVVRYIYQACECGLLKYGSKLIIDVDDNPSDVFKSNARQSKKILHKCNSLLQSYLVNVAINKIRKSTYHLFYSNPIQANKKKTTYLHNVTLLSAKNSSVDFSQSSNRILMVANFGYYPNTLGLRHFMSSIYPLIKEKKNDVELWLVGKMPQELKEEYQLDDSVSIFGYVDDLAGIYQQVKAVVVPIYLGAGTCVKVIETFQMKKPCVTTEYGVRGFNTIFQPNKDYLLAKTDEDFVNKVVQLLEDDLLGESLRSHAYNTVVDNFSTDRFKEIVHQVLLQNN